MTQIRKLQGFVRGVYWQEPRPGDPPRELTLSVEHDDGRITYVVLAIDRMTEPMSDQGFGYIPAPVKGKKQ